MLIYLIIIIQQTDTTFLLISLGFLTQGQQRDNELLILRKRFLNIIELTLG